MDKRKLYEKARRALRARRADGLQVAGYRHWHDWSAELQSAAYPWARAQWEAAYHAAEKTL